CWKTYLGRAETDKCRIAAMTDLGNGLSDAGHHEDALSVRESHLASLRRIVESTGGREESIFIMQSNLANSYTSLGRHEQALQLKRDAYSGILKVYGEENQNTLREANNYALSLRALRRFEEAKSLMRKMIPVARRVLGHNSTLTFAMRTNYARALFGDDAATLDDLREAATTLEDLEQAARRLFGGAHPLTKEITLCDTREPCSAPAKRSLRGIA
ncbi:unnamed protein product, partial [Pelagomonas calceolata]